MSLFWLLEYFFVRKMVYWIGFLGGFFSGFFGAGGGILMLPALIYIVKMDETKARGTALVTIFAAVLVAAAIYSKNCYLNWKIAVPVAIGGAIGGFLGAKFVLKIPKQILNLFFDFFLIYTAFKLFFAS